MHELMR